MAKELKRLNMNMPADLLEKVDEYAESMNVNRSAAINMLVSMGLKQNDMIDISKKMLFEIQDAKSKGLLQ